MFNDESAKFINSVPENMNGDKDWKEPFYSREDVPPILETPKYWLLNVLRDDLIWLCPVDREGKGCVRLVWDHIHLGTEMCEIVVDPMLVFEFIHRIIDILTDYLAEVSEPSIRENFVTVYQLLEEMMDYGYPLTTEPNTLKDIIMPPTIMNRVMTTVNAAAGYIWRKRIGWI